MRRGGAVARGAAGGRNRRARLQTSNLNLNPEYRYQDNQPPQLVGYQAVNQVSVRFRDIAKTGAILDALVAQGANQINGPTLTIERPEAALDEARTQALANARARAELYARALGMRVARVLSVSEAATGSCRYAGRDGPPDVGERCATQIEPGGRRSVSPDGQFEFRVKRQGRRTAALRASPCRQSGLIFSDARRASGNADPDPQPACPNVERACQLANSSRAEAVALARLRRGEPHYRETTSPCADTPRGPRREVDRASAARRAVR